MVQELYRIHSLSAQQVALAEAHTQEDEKIIVNTDIKETTPGSRLENELRDYIRRAILTRNISYIFLHCTATQPEATVSSILNYWKNNQGWKNPGYHILCGVDKFTVLSSFNDVSNGAKGYNSNGIHLSYIGGIDKKGKAKDTRTDFQKRFFEICLEELKKKLPKAKVVGHNEVASKACPSFKVRDEYPKYWTGK